MLLCPSCGVRPGAHYIIIPAKGERKELRVLICEVCKLNNLERTKAMEHALRLGKADSDPPPPQDAR